MKRIYIKQNPYSRVERASGTKCIWFGRRCAGSKFACSMFQGALNQMKIPKLCSSEEYTVREPIMHQRACSETKYALTTTTTIQSRFSCFECEHNFERMRACKKSGTRKSVQVSSRGGRGASAHFRYALWREKGGGARLSGSELNAYYCSPTTL